MISVLPSVHKIVMEASSKEDKDYMKSMSKDDIHQINGTLVQNLYASTIERKNIDFEDIPKSAGDIDKYLAGSHTVESLDTLQHLYDVNHLSEPGIGVVRNAISNMRKFRPQFITGFKMNHEFVELTYNSLVMSIEDATSLLISSYVTYIVSAGDSYQLSNGVTNNRGFVAIDNLKKFNNLSENGNMVSALNYMVDEGRKAFAGAEIIIPAVVVVCLLSIVPLTREIIYHYYRSRIKLADFLSMQADFLEMNKLAVESSKKSPAEKKNIIKKQGDLIKKMRRRADKLMINDVDTNDIVKKEVKDENSLWSLQTIEKQISNNKLNGASLNII